MSSRLNRRRLLAVTASGAALSALAGCLGDDDDGEDDGGNDDGDDDSASGDPLEELDQEFLDEMGQEIVDMTGEDVVEIETRHGDEDDGEPDFVFDPAFVVVDEGTTIEWVNTDGVFHTVTSTDSLDNRGGGGDEFDENFSSEGDTIEWVAEGDGMWPYYCSPHASFMYGAIGIE